MSGGGAEDWGVFPPAAPRLLERSPALSLTDAVRVSEKDAKRTAGKGPVGDEDCGNVARAAPAVWGGRLGLYESIGVGDPRAAGKAPSSGDGEVWTNSVAFVGGPVWAIDWLGEVSLFGEVGPGHQVVAVVGQAEGCHETAFGLPIKGRTYIQVWSMGKLAANGKAMSGSPSLLMLIGVDSGAVHDLAWCRWEGMACGSEGLGLLGVASGDGSLQILSVPQPEREWGAERRAVELAPVVRLMVEDGARPFTGCGTSVRWGPDPGAEGSGFAAFGCTTGEVFVVPVPGRWEEAEAVRRGAELGLVVLKSDEQVGVLCLDFAGDDSNTIVTGHTDGSLNFWDINKPLWPVFGFKSGKRCFITDVRWMSGNGGIVLYTMESGTVQLYVISTTTGRILLERPFASWGCDVSAMQERVVIASSEGLVVQTSPGDLEKLSTAAYKVKAKRHPAKVMFEVSQGQAQPNAENHEAVHVVGMTWAGKGAMDLDVHRKRTNPRESMEQVEVKKAKKDKKVVVEVEDEDQEQVLWDLPDLDVAVHRAKFHPGGEGLLLWAGKAGFMHCCVIPTDNLPDF